jgi:DNA polymerase I
MNGKLYLIDGHALIFKMYYAFLRRPMVNSKGADTSILFGFTKYLLELLERERPTHIAVAFDPPGGTFRNQLYPQYKANRPPTPQLIIDALEPLTELVQAMNIPVLMLKGYEADDVIGTIAKRSADEGLDVYMVTPDKDYGQLIDKTIYQYKPGKSGNDNEIIDVKGICERYGIGSPLQVIDMLTICGDTADNVPGVKGVGEVGAAKLISKYGSVENIYDHIGELSARQQAMFLEAKDHIALSKDLVTIRTDVPVEAPTETMRLDMNFSPALADLFEKYEFNSLRRHIPHISSAPKQTSKPQTVSKINIIPAAEAANILTALTANNPSSESASELAGGRCAIQINAAGTGIFAQVTGVELCFGQDGQLTVSRGSLADFRQVLEDERISKCGVDLKLQLCQLAHAGVEMKGKLLDISLMHYLLNPERSHSLDILAQSYLGISLDSQAEAGESVGSLFGDEQAPEQQNDDSQQLAAILQLSFKLEEELMNAGAKDLYDRIEEPLLKVLARMERSGMKVDLNSLREFSGQLREEILKHENAVRELAGEPGLNVSSPKQIGTVLFEKLQLDPKAKKSARGAWSTDEETLLALADRSPIIGEILEFRAAKKLLSTYIEPFPSYVSPLDARVHTTFNQALTATGRLSSSNPNLQNIPIRTERGKEIRKAFTASKQDWLIMSADYSQIELRIMAHLSCDRHLITAFKAGEDVHRATAAKIFGVATDEVTSDQRRIAKTANFGIMYGISAFGLAQRLHCPRSEAKKIIDDYFLSFPSIRSFIDDTVTAARESGYVETLFGRRRYLPDIDSKNATVRSLAERNAVNAPIQGTSADIIKLAMIAIDRRMREAGLQAMMVLQIHDELLFELPPEELETLRKIVVEEMENVVELSVPLTVECSYGKNWLESHQ